MSILLFGGLILDRYFMIDEYPQASMDGLILDDFDIAGGCAINMAMTIKNLGGTGHVVSCLGDDSWGQDILKYMNEQELSNYCIAMAEGKTGYCLVFVEPNGERTFLTAKGIESVFSEDLIPEGIEENCRVAAVTGYYLLDKTAIELVEYLKKLKDKGVKILFDPSPLVEKIASDILNSVMELSDLLLPNIQEAQFLAGNRDVEDWALSYNKLGKDIIIKRGSAGGELFQEANKISYSPISVNAIDTTGAGDSFSGAIAYCLARGIELKKAISIASACASIVTTIKGPHGNFGIMDLPVELQKYL